MYKVSMKNVLWVVSYYQTQSVGPKPTFYFYQARNGSHVYLHSLNIKMLVQEYGSLEHCPPIIKAKLVEKVNNEDLNFYLNV